MGPPTTLGSVDTLAPSSAGPANHVPKRREASDAGRSDQLERSGGTPGTPREPRPAKRRPRRVRALTLDDWLSLGGSVLASFALLYVGYLHLLDLSGTVGFIVCWYFVFLLV